MAWDFLKKIFVGEDDRPYLHGNKAPEAQANNRPYTTKNQRGYGPPPNTLNTVQSEEVTLHQHSFKPTVGLLKAPPRVLISDKAYRQIYLTVKHSPLEVGWWGVVKRMSGNDFLIEEIFIPRQEVTGVETDPSFDGLQELYMNLADSGDDGLSKIEHLRFWGHSHVNMATYPSATDENTPMVIGHHSGTPFVLRGIFNKRGNARFTLFDFQSGYRYDDIPWTVLDMTTYAELPIATELRYIEEPVPEAPVAATTDGEKPATETPAADSEPRLTEMPVQGNITSVAETAEDADTEAPAPEAAAETEAAPDAPETEATQSLNEKQDEPQNDTTSETSDEQSDSPDSSNEAPAAATVSEPVNPWAKPRPRAWQPPRRRRPVLEVVIPPQLIPTPEEEIEIITELADKVRERRFRPFGSFGKRKRNEQDSATEKQQPGTEQASDSDEAGSIEQASYSSEATASDQAPVADEAQTSDQAPVTEESVDIAQEPAVESSEISDTDAENSESEGDAASD